METINPVNIYHQKINMINNRVSARMSAVGLDTGFSGILREACDIQDTQRSETGGYTEKEIKDAIKSLGISQNGSLLNVLAGNKSETSDGSSLTDALFGTNSSLLTSAIMNNAAGAYSSNSALADALTGGGLSADSVLSNALLKAYGSNSMLEDVLGEALAKTYGSGNSKNISSSNGTYKSSGNNSYNGIFDESKINPDAEIGKHTEYEYLIGKAAEKYGVSDILIKAIIKAESDFNPESVSGAGAVGLMQLMPETAKVMGVKNSYDPEENINGGVGYFKQQLDSFGGDIKMALAAYNCGPSRLKKLNITNLDNASDFAKLPKETQNYVNKIITSLK